MMTTDPRLRPVDDNGYLGNPFRRRNEAADDSLGAGNETPVDLAAVQADDARLDMLGAGPASGIEDAELARVLVAWRRDVDAEPIGELVDTDTAVTVIGAARRPPRHTLRGAVASALAVLVISISGLGLVAARDEPGELLWPLTQLLYPEYAEQRVAELDARAAIDDARAALRRGDVAAARAALQRASVALPLTGEDVGRGLRAEYLELQLVLSGGPR